MSKREKSRASIARDKKFVGGQIEIYNKPDTGDRGSTTFRAKIASIKNQREKIVIHCKWGARWLKGKKIWRPDKTFPVTLHKKYGKYDRLEISKAKDGSIECAFIVPYICISAMLWKVTLYPKGHEKLITQPQELKQAA